ncbi:MAG: hypothetical protein A07HR60_01244 [uncultured archaeon A07HR60]|nr:MAG: hypothetical protein A07HR60_01244 [uncultured archaeon A07HR60]
MGFLKHHGLISLGYSQPLAEWLPFSIRTWSGECDTGLDSEIHTC